jgi:hypothetical protein
LTPLPPLHFLPLDGLLLNRLFLTEKSCVYISAAQETAKVNMRETSVIPGLITVSSSRPTLRVWTAASMARAIDELRRQILVKFFPMFSIRDCP